MNWKLWIKYAAIRAVKTVAQTAASLIAVGAVMSDINWPMVGSAALLAGILSVLTSIAGLPEVEMAKLAQDNEDCYVQTAIEANELREELYPAEEVEENDG